MKLIIPSWKREVGQICTKCGLGRFKLKKGKYGYFLGCSNFPACKETFGLKMIKDFEKEVRLKKNKIS